MNLLKNEWEVREISKDIARPFVEKWHYAHTSSAVAVSCYGLYYKGDRETLHGISWWMPPPLFASKSVSQDHRSVLALSRFCLVDDRPENSGSFLISKSIKLLDTKRWTTLLTYADTGMNHDGGLYRASNWNYNGLTGKNAIWWDNENQCMVSRYQNGKSYNTTQMREMGYELKGRFAKHKFVYPINRRRIQHEAQLTLAFNKEGKIINPIKL
tara:strand:+ start:1377 stop:2015 length:639 start_codon:yes stop_codon:yes gene_type:complete